MCLNLDQIQLNQMSEQEQQYRNQNQIQLSQVRGLEQMYLNRDQIQLNSLSVLQHLEADQILSTEILLLRIDAHVEVVIKQVVVGAIRAIGSAKNIAFGHRLRSLRGKRRRRKDRENDGIFQQSSH